MSCLTTLTPEAKGDCLDPENHLVPILEEIDAKLDDILTRLAALEAL